MINRLLILWAILSTVHVHAHRWCWQSVGTATRSQHRRQKLLLSKSFQKVTRLLQLQLQLQQDGATLAMWRLSSKIRPIRSGCQGMHVDTVYTHFQFVAVSVSTTVCERCTHHSLQST
jgi:hypothetical protein